MKTVCSIFALLLSVHAFAAPQLKIVLSAHSLDPQQFSVTGGTVNQFNSSTASAKAVFMSAKALDKYLAQVAKAKAADKPQILLCDIEGVMEEPSFAGSVTLNQILIYDVGNCVPNED
jgi:hypothetical protein